MYRERQKVLQDVLAAWQDMQRFNPRDSEVFERLDAMTRYADSVSLLFRLVGEAELVLGFNLNGYRIYLARYLPGSPLLVERGH